MKEYIIELSDNEKALSILVKAYNLHELIRCKNCIFGEQINNRYICTNAGHCQSKSNEPDWFCADGKKKDAR